MQPAGRIREKFNILAESFREQRRRRRRRPNVAADRDTAKTLEATRGNKHNGLRAFVIP